MALFWAADRRLPMARPWMVFPPIPSRALSKSWVASNSPSVEAIEQFSVDTNGYKAEFGHAGGGDLTYVSKSRHQSVSRFGV